MVTAAVIIVLLVLVFSVKAKLILKNDEGFYACVRILFFKINLLKKETNDEAMTLKKAQKRLEKLQKKKLKSAKKSKKDKNRAVGHKKEHKKAKRSFSDTLDLVKLIISMVKEVLKSFGRHARIKFCKMLLTVATSDAAKTAIAYGGVCAAVSTLAELLGQIKGFDKSHSSITVTPDYLSEKSCADIHIEIGVRVWHVFAFAISALKGLIVHVIKKSSNTENEKTETADKNKKTENQLSINTQGRNGHNNERNET